MTRHVSHSVLFVTGAYHPELSAGGLQCRAIAHLLKGRVNTRVITTSTNPTVPAKGVVDGVLVSRIKVDANSRWSAMRASVMMGAELLRIVPRVGLIHIQGFSTKNILVSAVSKLFRRPLLLHLQTARHDEPSTIKALGPLAWWAYSSADLYFSVSPSLTASYLAAGLPAGRLREVPNGVDVARFSPATPDDKTALRERLNLPLDRQIILFVGVMSPDKQPDVLFEAWAALQQDARTPASTLVFVGATDPTLFELGGQLAARLREDAERRGLRDGVIFVPPTHEIENYYRAADVFAMPSAREGLPIVLLEAMASGLPCVASRLPGSTDAVIQQDVNGRLVPSGDIAALAGALADLLANPGAAVRLGAAARRTVEQRFTIARIAEQWLAAYDHVGGTA